MIRDIIKQLLKMIYRFRSFKVLVVSGLLCLTTVAFYVTMVTYHPEQMQRKQFPNNQQELHRGVLETNFYRLQINTHPIKDRSVTEAANKKVDNSSTSFTNFVIIRGKSSDIELSTMETNSVGARVSEKTSVSKPQRGWHLSFGNHQNRTVHMITKSSQQQQGDEMAERNTNWLNPVKKATAKGITHILSSDTSILPHSIIKNNGSSKLPVPFDELNLTKNLQHVYAFNKQYPSSEGRSFLCVQTRTNPSFNVCVFPVKEDIHVSGSLQQSGTWDMEQTLLIQKALNRFPMATFIDVGANIGYFSLLARAMGRTVIAIEPTDASFLRLQEGVVRNNFSDKILMLKYAVSDKRTTVVMGEDKQNKGGIAVAREIDGPANISRSVEAITLDDLVNLIPSKEIIIKMDIEGYECRALHSSLELLQKFKVRYIFMEWLIMPLNQDKKDTPCPKANILHTLANMYSLGFKPYSVHGSELDINNSGSWTAKDIFWKPANSPNLL